MPDSVFWWVSESCSTLQGIEVVELIEAQQAQLPKVAVVDLAFLEKQLAANDEVAGDGVALKLDFETVNCLPSSMSMFHVTVWFASSKVGSGTGLKLMKPF